MDEGVKKDNESTSHHPFSLSSTIYKRLNWTFVVGYTLVAAGDNLQVSYRYALYDSYGIDRSTIELLYIASYISSLVIGTFTSALADRYGRRLACFFCAGFLILHCILINFSLIWILVIGSVFWGIANAFFHTAFEAWLIQEYRDRLLEYQLFQRILRNGYVATAAASIGVGVLAQLLAHLVDFKAPFDAAIIFFVLMIIFIWYFWPENYGSKDAKATTTFTTAIQILRADPRIVLLGMATAFFNTSLFIYLIEWTPALQRAQSSNDNHPLPFGLIFALLMIFDMIGSFMFDALAKKIRVQSYMIVVFLLTVMALLIPVIFPHSLPLILISFVTFQTCIGIYRPSIGLLRSSYIPDEVRATIMSYMRVPQMIFMLIILLGHFSLTIVFILCTSCNLLAMLCMIALRGLKLPEEEENKDETEVLLNEPSSPSFKLKQPQPQISLPESVVPKISTKLENSE